MNDFQKMLTSYENLMNKRREIEDSNMSYADIEDSEDIQQAKQAYLEAMDTWYQSKDWS